MAKVIMIQGTASNAGKSFIVAGLCRVFKQDGYKVAPFKSQNMALNSFITKDGHEMGRAQVMQAEASGIEPDVRMNPILLKPTSKSGCQVILNGEVLKDMDAKECYEERKNLVSHILNAYNSLDEEYDIIVIEGAGSPAEINLRKNDIVNMGLAELVDAPVILVGDIDRGGVFASLAGTLLLLSEDERERVKGMLINKFRGDVKLLGNGIEKIEEITNKQVLGVVPYINVDIDDEDSISEKLDNRKTDFIDIAVIRFPRISNFTDFNVFDMYEGVSVRYITSAKKLNNPDMIILPGTKNTIDDLKWLRQSGLEGLIKKQANKGVLIFGVCGGYQMLGQSINDEKCVEVGGVISGLGLLNTQTVFCDSKTTTQVEGMFKDIEGPYKCLSGKTFRGYEIHMGETKICQNKANKVNILSEIKVVSRNNGNNIKQDGVVNNNIAGSYVHGIFDDNDISSSIIQMLYNKKGIGKNNIDNFNIDKYKQEQYDKLAETIRRSVDIKKIYDVLDLNVKLK